MSKKRIKMKPGKGQSTAGFAFGIIFCLIGLFVVVPTFGAFGVFWTLAAVVITVMNGANAFTDKGIATHEITIEDSEDYFRSDREEERETENQSRRAGKSDSADVEQRLEAAKRLYQSGLITEEEYTAKRKQILEEL